MYVGMSLIPVPEEQPSYSPWSDLKVCELPVLVPAVVDKGELEVKKDPGKSPTTGDNISQMETFRVTFTP